MTNIQLLTAIRRIEGIIAASYKDDILTIQTSEVVNHFNMSIVDNVQDILYSAGMEWIAPVKSSNNPYIVFGVLMNDL